MKPKHKILDNTPQSGKRSFSLTCAHDIGRCRSNYHTITSTAAPLVVLEVFEDIKGVIRIRKLKDIQYNGQMKKDKRTNNDLQINLKFLLLSVYLFKEHHKNRFNLSIHTPIT